eukprot:2284793-Amphidinium_carterae.1
MHMSSPLTKHVEPEMLPPYAVCATAEHRAVMCVYTVARISSPECTTCARQSQTWDSVLGHQSLGMQRVVIASSQAKLIICGSGSLAFEP